MLTYLDMTSYVTNQNPADPEIHEKLLVSAPFFHVAGATAMMLAIWGGRTLVILPAFTPELWLQAVDQEKATHAFVVPTMLKRIMEDPNFDKYDISSMQSITYGAAPMPYEVVRRACDIFSPRGIGLINAYGQTETTATLTFLGPEDHDLSSDTERSRNAACAPSASPCRMLNSASWTTATRSSPPAKRAKSACARARDEGLLQAGRGDQHRHHRWLAAHRRPRQDR